MFQHGKQMNIWRTPGCELPRDSVLSWAPRVRPIYTLQKLILPFSEKAAWRDALSSCRAWLHLQLDGKCALPCIPLSPAHHDPSRELQGWLRKWHSVSSCDLTFWNRVRLQPAPLCEWMNERLHTSVSSSYNRDVNVIGIFWTHLLTCKLGVLNRSLKF